MGTISPHRLHSLENHRIHTCEKVVPPGFQTAELDCRRDLLVISARVTPITITSHSCFEGCFSFLLCKYGPRNQDHVVCSLHRASLLFQMVKTQMFYEVRNRNFENKVVILQEKRQTIKRRLIHSNSCIFNARRPVVVHFFNLLVSM